MNAVFEGRDTGPHRAALTLQCGLALFIAGRSASIASGIATALEAVESGRAQRWMAAAQGFRAECGAMSGFLEGMATSSAQRVAQAMRTESAAALERRARTTPAAAAAQAVERGLRCHRRAQAAFAGRGRAAGCLA